MSDLDTITTAHGVLGVVAWVVFFPAGAIVVRTMHGPNTWLVHASIQALAIAIFTASVGLGIRVAIVTQQLNDYHPIIGLVLFAVVFFQAAGGALHHTMYAKHKRRTAVSHAHIWLGRAVITLGMINGGLGLLLNGDGTKGEYIAYGVITGLIWVVWVALSAMGETKRSGRTQKSLSTSETVVGEHESKA